MDFALPDEVSLSFDFSAAELSVFMFSGLFPEVSIVQATSPTPAVSPSLRIIFSFPEFSAIKGKVALSDSISQIVSSTCTKSPSDFSQLPISTSVIDSPGLGILISTTDIS